MIARWPLFLALCAVMLGIGIPSVLSAQRRAPGSGIPLPRIETVTGNRLDRLERWMKAVARHAPGDDDDAVEEIAGWSNADLRGLWIDANILIQMPRGNGRAQFSVRAEGQKTFTQIQYTTTQVARLQVLACVADGALFEARCLAIKASDGLDGDLRRLAVLIRAAKIRGEDSYIMRRGALLHADVAILAPDAKAAVDAAASSAGPQRLRMDISDGREIDLHQSALHWEIARMLLDYVTPKSSSRAGPGRDEMVLQWYRATAAWMQLREDHDRLHLDRARELFPGDPDILFLSACQRETYAGPPIQAAVRSAVLPTGVTMDVSSERVELRAAEALFRHTLEVKPDHAEARMRYGRVLGALGKHPEAAVELRRATVELTDAEQQYYASMFLGAEEEALSNREAAGAAYERAAVLAPRAQSPLLAISQLSRRYGDRAGALRAMERLFTLPGDRSRDDDPWWWYYVVQARAANDLLEAMRRPFLSDRLQ